MRKLNIPHILNESVTEKDINQLEISIGQSFPPMLREFYLKYYSLEFDGSMLFETDESMEVVRGDEDIEVSVHRILSFDEIIHVKRLELQKDGYKEFFCDLWDDSIPFASGMGDSGYFLVGAVASNYDAVLFLSYTDNTVIKVCPNIFDFFNTKLQEY